LEKTLRLIFRNVEGRSVTISVKDPEDTIEAEDVEDAMDQIMEANVFTSSGGDLTQKVRAEVVGRTVDLIAEF
jgi:hypothetical protein